MPGGLRRLAWLLLLITCGTLIEANCPSPENAGIDPPFECGTVDCGSHNADVFPTATYIETTCGGSPGPEYDPDKSYCTCRLYTAGACKTPYRDELCMPGTRVTLHPNSRWSNLGAGSPCGSGADTEGAIWSDTVGTVRGPSGVWESGVWKSEYFTPEEDAKYREVLDGHLCVSHSIMAPDCSENSPVPEVGSCNVEWDIPIPVQDTDYMEFTEMDGKNTQLTVVLFDQKQSKATKI